MFEWIEELMKTTGCDYETDCREYTMYKHPESYYVTYIQDEDTDYYYQPYVSMLDY